MNDNYNDFIVDNTAKCMYVRIKVYNAIFVVYSHEFSTRLLINYSFLYFMSLHISIQKTFRSERVTYSIDRDNNVAFNGVLYNVLLHNFPFCIVCMIIGNIRCVMYILYRLQLLFESRPKSTDPAERCGHTSLK